MGRARDRSDELRQSALPPGSVDSRKRVLHRLPLVIWIIVVVVFELLAMPIRASFQGLVVALAAVFAPTSLATGPFVIGPDSCPGLTVPYVRIESASNGSAHVEIPAVICDPVFGRRDAVIDVTTSSLFPVVADVPTGRVLERDADGDGVPTLFIESYQLMVYGNLHVERGPPHLVPLGLPDPDDGDPANPLEPSAAISVSAGCERDALCADASTAGPADYDVHPRVLIAPLTDAANGTTGQRPAEIRRDVVFVHGVAPPSHVESAPSSAGHYAQRVHVGTTVIDLQCAGPGYVVTPAVDLEGILHEPHVLSYRVPELPPVAHARCLVLGFASLAVPIAPVGVVIPPPVELPTASLPELVRV